MTNRELGTILSETKNERRGGAPHEVWVERSRDVLLMQVRNTTDMHARTPMSDVLRHLFSIFMPMEAIGAFAHGMGVFLLVVGSVLGGGVASAHLYADATPGQMLYGVKLSVEKAQLILSPNTEYEAGLHAKFADNRIDEVAKLSEQGPERQALVPGVLVAFDKEIAALAAGIDAMRHDGHDGLTETAKLMERKMAGYESKLTKAGHTLAAEYHPSLAVSTDLVNGTSLKAIAVIVDSHLADAASVPRAVVVTKFEERILQAEAHFVASATTEAAGAAVVERPATTRAKAAIAEAKELLKTNDYKAALSKIEEVAVLTKEAEAEEEAAAKEEEAAMEEEVLETEPVTEEEATVPETGSETETVTPPTDVTPVEESTSDTVEEAPEAPTDTQVAP